MVGAEAGSAASTLPTGLQLKQSLSCWPVTVPMQAMSPASEVFDCYQRNACWFATLILKVSRFRKVQARIAATHQIVQQSASRKCIICNRQRSKHFKMTSLMNRNGLSGKLQRSTARAPALVLRPVQPFTARQVTRKLMRNAATDGDAPATSGIEKTGPNFTAAKDIDAIMKTLPHRSRFA